MLDEEERSVRGAFPGLGLRKEVRSNAKLDQRFVDPGDRQACGRSQSRRVHVDTLQIIGDHREDLRITKHAGDIDFRFLVAFVAEPPAGKAIACKNRDVFSKLGCRDLLDGVVDSRGQWKSASRRDSPNQPNKQNGDKSRQHRRSQSVPYGSATALLPLSAYAVCI